MNPKTTNPNKAIQSDTDGTVPMDEIAAAVIKKRDWIAKSAGIEPEEVTLAAYKLIFVVGKPVRGKIIGGALVVQASAVRKGFDFVSSLVDDEHDGA